MVGIRQRNIAVFDRAAFLDLRQLAQVIVGIGFGGCNSGLVFQRLVRGFLDAVTCLVIVIRNRLGLRTLCDGVFLDTSNRIVGVCSIGSLNGIFRIGVLVRIHIVFREDVSLPIVGQGVLFFFRAVLRVR